MRPAYYIAALAVLSVVLGGIHQTGQDVNFDQLNYHFYSAYAFLHDRMAIDAAPAGTLHSYFNPLPYLPFYWLVQHLPPRRAIFILGAWHGLNLWLVLLIAWQVTARMQGTWRFVACAGAVAISAASPMALLEWATSFADITTSLLVLGGVSAMIAARSGGKARSAALPVVAGAGLVGLAIGLKLTNAIYAPGILACCLIGMPDWRARLRALALAAVAGACGSLVSGGFWFYRLWRTFRSPVFPYYDGIFKSPDSGLGPRLHGVSFYDDRFPPHGIWQAIELPFRWITLNTTTCERGFVDIRFAVLLVLLIACVTRMAILGMAKIPSARDLPTAGKQLVAFFCVAFAVWEFQFGIQRYAVGLEFLAGPAIVVALLTVLPSEAGAIASLCIACVCLATVTVPDFGRIKARKSWYGIELPARLRSPGIVFLQDDALSFLVPSLPAESRVAGLISIDGLQAGAGNFADRQIRRSLAEGPAWPISVLLNAPLSLQTRALLGGYGLGGVGPCTVVPNHAAFVLACDLHRMAGTAATALTLHPGETLTFGASVKNAAAYASPVLLRSGWAVLGAGSELNLDVRLDGSFGLGPFAVSIGFSGEVGGREDASLVVRANGQPVGKSTTADLLRANTVQECVPASALDASRNLLIGLDYTAPPGSAPPRISLGLASLKVEQVARCP